MCHLIRKHSGLQGTGVGPIPVRDIGGHEIFSQGASGEAHALAHRPFDTGQFELGHQLPGERLAGCGGQVSDRVHLLRMSGGSAGCNRNALLRSCGHAENASMLR